MLFVTKMVVGSGFSCFIRIYEKSAQKISAHAKNALKKKVPTDKRAPLISYMLKQRLQRRKEKKNRNKRVIYETSKSNHDIKTSYSNEHDSINSDHLHKQP